MDKPIRVYQKDTDELDYNFEYNDKETKALHARLNRTHSISEDDLRRVSLWKSNRVLEVSEDTLEILSHIASDDELKLRDDAVRSALDRLVLSQGIGFPMASAILKFIRPDVFPIIDVRAYRALTGNKPYYNTYSYDKYIAYAEALSEIALRTGRPLREIDEQLYCFDKVHNGRI
ncbi:hypothetical protein [Pseudomonas sp. G2-4]|uniref:hypothetical protein n=1 Tax=Pseudomonas sp. G2-4 TaxID=1506334 RepID=UPI0024BA2DBD|nr:hypothetical protein [Pseudomonas sp. G2-4]WHS60479.1 hypothetical protein QNH97_00105 [Pseudomonas sp. G2-4]